MVFVLVFNSIYIYFKLNIAAIASFMFDANLVRLFDYGKLTILYIFLDIFLPISGNRESHNE